MNFKWLYKNIDNTALVVFRIIFGALIFLESIGAIFTGWVHANLINPQVYFSFIGFEWLQPLPGYGMYFYYGIMGLCGLGVMLGFKYRYSLGLFTLLWIGSYLMQKTSYNNHYFLLILLCILMLIVLAHHYASIDTKLNPNLKKTYMPAWAKWILILQMWIVYTYAAVAKMYPDWLDLSVVTLLMKGKASYPLVGALLQENWVIAFVSYAGIMYDLLIIPLLLYKPTRKWAFAASLVFHLFNSIVFQVGIFPYLSLAFILFFFEAEKINRIFLKKKPFYNGEGYTYPKQKLLFQTLFISYFIYQVLMPLRHWVIPGNVLWTEEGHRMSWRMMLRSKSGFIRYTIKDKDTKQVLPIDWRQYLTPKQQRHIATHPDCIWQYAQFLHKQMKEKGHNVTVHASSLVSVNGNKRQELIDKTVDLAAVEWNYFGHNSWILPYQKE